MKKLVILGFALFLSGQITFAQRSCGVMHHHEELVKKDQQVQRNLDEINKFTEQYVKSGVQNKTVINIPVVVHVVYSNSTQNISTAQIQSQLAVLNADFRKLNADASSVPSTFSSIAADCEINFCLATVDPSGNPTSGIIRKSTTTSVFNDNDNVKYNSTGGSTAWDASKYMNIWVCNLGSQLLGYAQFPGGPAATDGVVMNYTAFGTTGTAQAPFNKGRTATHEVGHYLNIYHIGGDTYGGCGSDQVSDTPTQKGGSSASGTGNDYGQNYGCPSHPLVRSGECSGTSAEMFMNYMDYTDDACMYMFTNGQKSRMQALFTTGGFRASLATSTACGGTPTPSYCAAASTNVSYEWINNVTLGSINNTTTANGGYSDFTSIATNLTTGTNYSISLKPAYSGSTYSEFFNVYIDYNNDQDFDDAGELVYSSAGTTTTISGSFTVPSNATVGATRMRIIMKDGSISGPCISYTYGEVEDYTVNIVSPQVCNAPSGLGTSGITTSAATLSWSAVTGASNYTVEYKTSAASTWTSANTASTSYNLSGLASSTTYNWRVTTNCSFGSSTATTGTNFTTSTPAVCNAPSGLGTSGITTSAATLSWSAVSGATNYTLQYKTSAASTWTSVNTASTSYTLSGLASSTTYNWRVNTNCSSGSSAITTGANFTTATPSTGYCAANSTNVSYEYINNVTFGSINNTTTANGGYSDYTSISASLAQGSTNTISLKPAYTGSSYTEYFNVYIDYNNDGDFVDAGELAYASAGTTTTITGSITIPATATTGATRMRVIMKDGSISGPCITYTYGEVEDYTINITASAPVCNAPTGLAVSALTSSTVTLSWSAVSGATDYTAQVKTSSASTWTDFAVSGTSLNLTGLTEGTTYNWRVSTNCASSSSATTTGSNFTAPTSAPTCSDVYESNETRTAAKTIAVNTDIIARIGSSSDVDYFKFTNTTAAKNIKITLTNLPFDYDLFLYNSSGTQLYKSENGSTTSETITYNGAPVATYYIRVIGYNGANSTDCYNLRAAISGSTFKVNPYAPAAKEDQVTSIFTVMPNPTTDGKFTVNLTNTHVGLVTVDVYDQAGRLVVQQQVDKAENFMKEAIDLSNKENGIYLVKIYNDQFNVMERIVFAK